MPWRKWIFTLVCLIHPVIAICEATPVDQAWQAIRDKNIPRAIEILETARGRNSYDYETQYLLARCYAWNGQVDNSLTLLNKLLTITPLNTDLLLSKATFLSWQNKTTEALQLLEKARNVNPNYQDVWKLELKLLNNQSGTLAEQKFDSLAQQYLASFSDAEYIQSLQTSFHQFSRNRQMLGVVPGYEILDNKAPDWKSLVIDYIYDTPEWTYTGEFLQVERYAINDQQVSLEVTRKNLSQHFVTGYLSISSRSKLLSVWTGAIKVNKVWQKNRNTELRYKHSAYDKLQVDNIKLAYSQVWKKLEPKLHVMIATFNNSQYTLGYLVQASYHFNDAKLIRASYGQNKEAEYLPDGFTTFKVSSISIDGRIQLDKHWRVTLALTHNIQGSVYKRNGLHTSIFYRF